MRLRHVTLSNALVVSLRLGMAVVMFVPSAGTTAGLDVNGDGTVDLEELAYLAAMVRDVSMVPDASGDGVQSLEDLFTLVESTDWPDGGSGAAPPAAVPGGNAGIEFSAMPLEMDAVSGEAVELTLSVTGMNSVRQFEIVLEVTPGVFDLATADLIPRIAFGGFLVFPAQVEGATTVRLGMTLLADEGVSGAGNMVIRLPVLDDLTGGTTGQVTLESVSLGPSTSHRVAFPKEVLGLSSLVRVSAPVPPTLDYDDDGVVGSGDFQIWADRFGAAVGEASYDHVFDVDGDDRVGYGDFFILGDNFGRASADAEIRTPARSQGARLAGDNAGATFSLTSAATVSGVGPGETVTMQVAGSGFVGIRNLDMYVRFSDADAFDLSQVWVTTGGGMSGWITLPGLVESGTTNLVRVGGACFGCSFTGDASFAINAITSSSFTTATQATIEIERISIGPSSSVRDVFVDPGLRVDINGGATTAPRFLFSGPGELNGVGPGEVISTDLLVSQPIPVTAFELVVELLPRGAFDLSSLTFSTATHVLLDSPTQALAARISLTSLGAVDNLGTLQVTTAPGFSAVTGATIRVTELEVLDFGTGLHTVYAREDLGALLFPINGMESFTSVATIAVASGAPSEAEDLTFGLAAEATDGLDQVLGEVERPPLPPEGVFDARFLVDGINGVTLDLRDPGAVAPVWEVRFQPGSSGYPIALSWDPASLPQGAWRMTDLSGGAGGIDFSMNNESSLVVADAGVTGVLISVVAGECAYDLQQGWSMVSLCGEPASGDATLAENFPEAISLFAFGGSYTQVAALSVGEGYWINMASAQTYTIPATPAATVTLDLAGGWSMIGGPDGSVSVLALQSTNPEVISVFGFDGSYYQATSMESGQGYWINMGSAGQVVLTRNPAARAVTTPVEAAFAQPAVWVESLGRRQEIQLGVEADQVVALPPVPPAGVLDARVDLGGVGTWRVPRSGEPREYTLRVQGEAVTLGWDIPDEFGGQWELVLEDRVVSLAGTGTMGEVATPAQLRLLHLGTMPQVLRLHPNYPNPFNPTTTIRYDLKESGPVTLRVYDTTGQLVQELVSEVQRAGAHQVEWDGRDSSGAMVSSGVYLYELRAGSSYRQVKKMLLMK